MQGPKDNYALGCMTFHSVCYLCVYDGGEMGVFCLLSFQVQPTAVHQVPAAGLTGWLDIELTVLCPLHSVVSFVYIYLVNNTRPNDYSLHLSNLASLFSPGKLSWSRDLSLLVWVRQHRWTRRSTKGLSHVNLRPSPRGLNQFQSKSNSMKESASVQSDHFHAPKRCLPVQETWTHFSSSLTVWDSKTWF